MGSLVTYDPRCPGDLPRTTLPRVTTGLPRPSSDHGQERAEWGLLQQFNGVRRPSLPYTKVQPLVVRASDLVCVLRRDPEDVERAPGGLLLVPKSPGQLFEDPGGVVRLV